MISTRTAVFAASFVLALSGAALAQDQAAAPQGGHGGGAFRAACGQDMQTYCGSAQSREDRHTCMKAKKDKFSDSCKSFMASRRHHGDGQPGGQ